MNIDVNKNGVVIEYEGATLSLVVDDGGLTVTLEDSDADERAGMYIPSREFDGVTKRRPAFDAVVAIQNATAQMRRRL